MNSIDFHEVEKYIQDNIGEFHQRRLLNLENLKLKAILQRKNPYLYRAKNISLAQKFVKVVLDAHLSSQEEGIFGSFLEGLARFVAGKTCCGIKSATEGIDLEFERDNKRFLVTIKSGPNWGNSGQIKRMIDEFNKAKRTLKTNNPHIEIVAVNGCCYGRDNNPYKQKGYYKFCGERFWTFITGNESFYKDIIDPLAHDAKRRNDRFKRKYNRLVNLFTIEFLADFCVDGEINWEAIVELNSAMTKPKYVRKKRKK